MVGPLVSVIIPSYNYGAFIHNALESLLWQSYDNWECIVVDDGSKDNTRDVVLRFVQKDNRIKYIHQQNAGVSSARNRALEVANGKYIQLLDADDLLEANKLKLQVELLEQNQNIDLVYSNMKYFLNSYYPGCALHPFLIKKTEAKLIIKLKEVEIKQLAGKGSILLEGLVEDNFFLPGCTLSKKSLFDDVGFFKKGIEGIEDWHYWYRATLLNKEFFHDERPDTALLGRLHGSNASGNNFKMLRGRIIAREDLMALTKAIAVKKDSHFSPQFLNSILRKHKTLLSRDKFKFNLLFSSFTIGILNMIKYAWYSKQPLFVLYDAARSIKNRIKGNK